MFGRAAGSALVSSRRRRFVVRLRAGGVRRKLLTLLVLLAIVIGVLPVIVAKTALRHVLLSMAIPKDTIQITIGDASLNWIGAFD